MNLAAISWTVTITLLNLFAQANNEWLGIDLCLSLANTIHAQTKEYPYSKYPDRKEGIVAQRQLVSGEKLVLVSAAIENSEPPPKLEPSTYRLGFYLEKRSRVEVIVREFENLYKMEPLRRDYEAGINVFAWPAEIPRNYDITIANLQPIGIVSGSGDERIVPVALFYDKPKNAELAYRFCFMPQQAIAVLEYKIYSSKSLEPIYTGTMRDLVAEKRAYLRWHGKDQKNNIAINGLYNLYIEATFRPAPGGLAVKVSFKFQFYHFSEILNDDWTSRK